MPSLKDRIDQDLVAAMKAGDNVSRDTLRMLKTALHNREIEKRGVLTDDDVVAVLRKEVKTRQEAVEGYRAGGREEAAQKEQAEKKLIEGYLPAGLAEDELERIVTEALQSTGITSLSDLGKVMKVVMSKVQGRAEGGHVSDIIRRHLS